MTRRAWFAATVTLSLLTLGVWPPADGAQRNDLLTEWRAYAGDQRGSRYSTATDITRDNLNTLVQVWEWKTGERERKEPYARPGQFTTTPLMIGGVLYFATPYNRVIALDAASGEEKWIYDPKAYELGTPALSIGFVHRGVTPWWDGSRLRLFYASRHRLISLDADTGQPVAGFGDGGIVDLSKGLMREIRAEHYEHNSPPLVFNDLVILGSSIGDRIMYKGDPPGQVRAFNARTGKQVWNFNLVPQRGEFGSDTWKNESWRFTGHANAWASMSVDEERGLIYVPTSTPSNDFYGGRRPGDNLFAESLVCLDAATGQRKWHFQVTHHGLWDYDVPAAPTLATVTVNGRRRDIVAQVTKNGFAFVFDRVTGEPIWPIEERPVPQTDVPGEQTARTQPFPTKPPAFVPQGVQLEDAFDLTPAMKSAAQAAMKRFRIGPIYTPPSEEGTLTRPSAGGGANWGGAALDPESGMLFVRATNTPFVIGIARFDKANTNNPYAEFVDVDYHIASYNRGGVRAPSFHDGLPLTKPPYALLTAIDLNTGDIAWQVPAGEGRHIKDHPALKGLTLPARVGSPHPAGVIVTKAGLVFGGGGDPALYAYDAKTGTELWRGSVQRRVSGTPMTYQLAGGRQFVVVATGGGEDAALVAFARPPAP